MLAGGYGLRCGPPRHLEILEMEEDFSRYRYEAVAGWALSPFQRRVLFLL